MIFDRKIRDDCPLDGPIQGHDKVAPSNVYNVEEPDNSKPVERRGRKAMDLHPKLGQDSQAAEDQMLSVNLFVLACLAPWGARHFFFSRVR